jgi:predicted nuclease of predicted toxin-antitoxin system
MLIKLDENLPAVLADMLREYGHEADTAPGEGLAGHSDDDVWAAVQRSGRFLFTQDLDFSDARKFTPGTHPGMLLIRLEHPSRRSLIECVERVVQTEDIETWKGCIVVATERKIRIRRARTPR